MCGFLGFRSVEVLDDDLVVVVGGVVVVFGLSSFYHYGVACAYLDAVGVFFHLSFRLERGDQQSILLGSEAGIGVGVDA